MRVAVTPALLRDFSTSPPFFSIVTAKYARVCFLFIKLILEIAELIMILFLLGGFSGSFFCSFTHCRVYIRFDPSPVKEKGKETQMYLLSYLVVVW